MIEGSEREIPPEHSLCNVSTLQPNAFPGEQRALPIQPAGESADLFVRRQHAMARHEHGNWIRPARAADRAHGLRFANRAGNLAIAARLAGTDFPQVTPHMLLKVGSARQIQW